MFRKVLLALTVLFVALVGAAYATGSPGSAYTTWTAYNLAVARKDGPAATNLISANVIEMLQRHRHLALTATEAQLLRGPMIDLLGAVRLRIAAFNQQPIRSIIEQASSPREFVAKFYNHGPVWDTSPFVPNLVVPLGPTRSVAWMGPAQDAGPHTLLFSMAAGARFTFQREEDHWRVDLSPMLRFPAREYDHYAGRTPGGRKQFLNNLYAHHKPLLQTAMWTPVRQWSSARKQ